MYTRSPSLGQLVTRHNFVPVARGGTYEQEGEVEYRRLGRSGLVVSAIGLGTNNFGTRLDETGARRVFDAALDNGVTFVDTADIYGGGESETILGRILEGRRENVVLATKGGMPTGDSPYEQGASRHRLRRTVEASLRRLRTDYIDLYQVHAPDPETPIAETLEALDQLVRSGKIGYIGTSNFAPWQLVDADWTARTEHLTRPVSAQYVENVLERDIGPELTEVLGVFGLGLIVARPLAYGFLTGKYLHGQRPANARLPESKRAPDIMTDANYERLERLHSIAEAQGHSILELALGWLLGQSSVSSVIASASSPEQLEEDLRSTAWIPGAEVMSQVAEI